MTLSFFAVESVNYDFTEHFNDEYQYLKQVENIKYYILDIFSVRKNVKVLVEKFSFKIENKQVQSKNEEMYQRVVKKLSEMIRTIYTVSRALPNYEIHFNNYHENCFDYKFYCSKKLNNDFVDRTHQSRKISVDTDIAKICLSIKYYLKSDIPLVQEKDQK